MLYEELSQNQIRGSPTLGTSIKQRKVGLTRWTHCPEDRSHQVWDAAVWRVALLKDFFL